MSTCREVKQTLSGAIETYACDLVMLSRGVGILRHVIDRTYRMPGFLLSPGDVTLAFYWEERPYTVYRWTLASFAQPIYYFNVADRIALAPAEFRWRDLAVDILIVPGSAPQVLDVDELPPRLPPETAALIAGTMEAVLRDHAALMLEIENLVRRSGC